MKIIIQTDTGEVIALTRVEKILRKQYETSCSLKNLDEPTPILHFLAFFKSYIISPYSGG